MTACRDNRWETCSAAQTEKDSNNIAFRDCLWAPSGIGTDGTCIPFVPPGLKFWSEGSDANRVPTAEATSQCAKGNSKCTVTWEKGGLSSEWEWVSNCQCLEKGWLEASNELCKFQGDCGAYINYI